MAKTAATAKPDAPAAQAKTARPGDQTLADASGGGSIGQIRDILFGSQMRDYEKKFSRMEERLLKEGAGLRAEFGKRFEQLNSFVRQEIAALAEGIKNEQEKRTAAIQKLAQELAEGVAAFGQRTDALEKQLRETSTDLRQQLLEQSHNLSEDISHKYEQAASELVQTARELRESKIDRSMLADLFVEVAMNLNGDLAAKLKTDVAKAHDA